MDTLFAKENKFASYKEFDCIYQEIKIKNELSFLRIRSKSLKNYSANIKRINLITKGWNEQLKNKETQICCIQDNIK